MYVKIFETMTGTRLFDNRHRHRNVQSGIQIITLSKLFCKTCTPLLQQTFVECNKTSNNLKC